jgi:hypothetical protein
MTTEKKWENIFALAPLTSPKVRSKKCTCGNDSCKHAKKIRCTCQCHSVNHGAANRVGMEPLDKVLGLEKEAPVPLGDLALNLELSGRAELEGMI